MIRGKLVIHSQRSDYGRYQGLIIGFEDSLTADFRYIKGPLQYVLHDTSRMLVDPTFEGGDVPELLQAMLNHAWSLGMRPTDYREERPAEIAAMNNHLQDMRRMVFGGKPADIPDFLLPTGTAVPTTKE